MRQDPQLDLAIVQGHQLEPLGRDEGLADAAALLGPDRDVLQVRLCRGQPARLRPGDRIAGMDPPRLGIHIGGQRVGIGRFQLADLAPVQHPRGQIVAFGGQILQHVGAGGKCPGLALLAAAQSHLVEQDLAQLLGAADVEALPRQPVDLILQPGHLLRECVRHALQHVGVDADARHLHLGQDRNHRAFQRVIDGRDLLHRQHRREMLEQAQRHVGILRRIGRGLVDGDLAEMDLALA